MDSNEKQVRSVILNQTDWVVLRALETGEPIPEDMKKYRQELRDLGENFPEGVTVWPTKPTGY